MTWQRIVAVCLSTFVVGRDKVPVGYWQHMVLGDIVNRHVLSIRQNASLM